MEKGLETINIDGGPWGKLQFQYVYGSIQIQHNGKAVVSLDSVQSEGLIQWFRSLPRPEDYFKDSDVRESD